MSKRRFTQKEVRGIVGENWSGLLLSIDQIMDNSKKLGGKVVFLIEDENSAHWSGFFDSDNRNIYVYFNSKNLSWLPVLIHEFAHLIQYVSKTKAQRDYFLISENESADIKLINKILKSERTTHFKNLESSNENKKLIQTLIDFESECDEFALEIMKKGGFSRHGYINLKEYIREANLFLYKLIFLVETGYYVIQDGSSEKKSKPFTLKGMLQNRLINSKSKIPNGLRLEFEKEVKEAV